VRGVRGAPRHSSASIAHLRMQRHYTNAAAQAKQSVRRAYATSGKAKDCREVVQRLNLGRQRRDEARGAAALDAAHRRSWSPDHLETRDVKVHGSKSIGGWSAYLQARPPLARLLRRIPQVPCQGLTWYAALGAQEAAAPEPPVEQDDCFVTVLPEAAAKCQKRCHAQAAGADCVETLTHSPPRQGFTALIDADRALLCR